MAESISLAQQVAYRAWTGSQTTDRSLLPVWVSHRGRRGPTGPSGTKITLNTAGCAWGAAQRNAWDHSVPSVFMLGVSPVAGAVLAAKYWPTMASHCALDAREQNAVAFALFTC